MAFGRREPRTRESLPLFDFQQEALDAVLTRWKEGVSKQIVSIPTGGGKTVLATHLVDKVGLPTVFMCHRDELVTQTREKFRQFDPTISTAICKAEQGRSVYELAGRDLVIASAQTLGRKQRLRTLVDAVGGGAFLIVDEAHHSAAESWRKAIAAINPTLLVGLTATPKRGDGAGLDGVFDEIVYAVPMSRLVKMGKLARPVGIAIGTGVDLDGVATRGGEFVESQLEVVVNTEARNQLVVDAWEKHAADRTHTIAFCVDVAHVKALTEAFRARGHRAEYVIGATPDHERRRIYSDFHDGKVQVLLSVMVLSEGFDEPRASCALMCRPTQSQSLYVQMAGRVLRRSPGKADALVLDFVDVSRRHSLQTVMTLAGVEPGGEREEKPKQGQLIDVFAADERKARVVAQTERLGDLLDASPFIWQQLPDGQWMARSSAGWITLVEAADGFVPVRVWWNKGVAGHEELFGRAVDADTAMSIAEASIDKNVLTDRGARWRDLPPTPGQLQAAGRWRVQVTPEMTRGQLTNLLDVAVFRVAMKKAGLNRRAG